MTTYRKGVSSWALKGSPCYANDDDHDDDVGHGNGDDDDDDVGHGNDDDEVDGVVVATTQMGR